MIMKRYHFFLIALLALVFSPSILFSASITNEGTTVAKVNARSAKGITGGGSIQPGQTLDLKSEITWVEHVPEGQVLPVSLRIIEGDGRVGYINSPGGRYAFQAPAGVGSPTASRVEKKTRQLAPGYAENRSNLAMLLSMIDKKSQQSYQLLLPGQKAVIPIETVEVIADRHGWSSGDVQIALLLVMPDGQEHTVRTTHAVVRISPDLDRD